MRLFGAYDEERRRHHEDKKPFKIDGRTGLWPLEGLPRKLSLVWNYLSVMPCNPTARGGGDDDGLRIPVVAVRDPDVVVDKEHRFEAPNTKR